MKPGSKAWKQFMAKLYGLGAAVVIVGALFKIMHWPGANLMLIIGLSTEAVIFIFSAFEPLHEEIDWSLVYPELAHGDDEELLDGLEDGHEVEHEETGAIEQAGGTYYDSSSPLTQQLDKMLEDANIDTELLKNLGDGMRTLGENAKKMQDAVEPAVATTEYSEALVKASNTVGSLSESYMKASDALMGITNPDEGMSAGEGLKRLSENLSAINDMYELQLKGSLDSVKATNEMFENVNELVRTLSESAEDTQTFKNNISELSNNIASLNKVYGNMLSAMRFNPE